MTWKSSLFLGLILLPIMLVVTLPARLAQQTTNLDLWPLRLYETRGYWWHGQTQILLGERHLGQWNWHWAPQALINGDMAFDGNLQGETISGSARLIPQKGAGLTLEQIRLTALTQALDFNEDLMARRPTGRLELDLDHLHLAPKHNPTATGKILWHGSGLTNPSVLELAPELGQIQLTLTEANTLKGTIHSTGPAQLTGEFHWEADRILTSGQWLNPGDSQQASLRDYLDDMNTGRFEFEIVFEPWDHGRDAP